MPDDIRMPERAVESATTLVDLAREADRLRHETEKFQAQLKAWGAAHDTDQIVNQTGHAGRIAQQFGQIGNLLRQRAGIATPAEAGPKGESQEVHRPPALVSVQETPSEPVSELHTTLREGLSCTRFQLTAPDTLIRPLLAHHGMKNGLHFLKERNDDGVTFYTIPNNNEQLLKGPAFCNSYGKKIDTNYLLTEEDMQRVQGMALAQNRA